MTAQQAFYKAFNGQRNFLTPNLVRYEEIPGEYFIEISSGSGIYNQKVYGVTILDFNLKHRTDLSNLFNHLQDAEDYIESLREKEEV